MCLPRSKWHITALSFIACAILIFGTGMHQDACEIITSWFFKWVASTCLHKCKISEVTLLRLFRSFNFVLPLFVLLTLSSFHKSFSFFKRTNFCPTLPSFSTAIFSLLALHQKRFPVFPCSRCFLKLLFDRAYSAEIENFSQHLSFPKSTLQLSNVRLHCTTKCFRCKQTVHIDRIEPNTSVSMLWALAPIHVRRGK